MPVADIRFRGEGAPLTFEEVLAQFKRTGCSLLVTGEVSPDVTALATRRLLGAPFEDRKRVLVLTDTDAPDVRAHLPAGSRSSDDDVTVIRRETQSRGATWDASETDPRTVGASLDDLADSVTAAIREYEDGGLTPAELRVSVNSLSPLLADHDYGEVVQFVRGLADVVEAADGMVHFHLPAPEGSSAVESVGTLVDARVELRRSGPNAEQRWHVPAYGQETNWVSL